MLPCGRGFQWFSSCATYTCTVHAACITGSPFFSPCDGQQPIVFHTIFTPCICPVWNIGAATNLFSAPKFTKFFTRKTIASWLTAVMDSRSRPSLILYTTQSSIISTTSIFLAFHSSGFLYTKHLIEWIAKTFHPSVDAFVYRPMIQ